MQSNNQWIKGTTQGESSALLREMLRQLWFNTTGGKGHFSSWKLEYVAKSLQISNQEQSGKSGKGLAEQDGKGLAVKDEREMAEKVERGLAKKYDNNNIDKQTNQASSSSSNSGMVEQVPYKRLKELQMELQEAKVELMKRHSYSERAYRMYENQIAEIRQFHYIENNMKEEIRRLRQENEKHSASLHAIAQNLRGGPKEANAITAQGWWAKDLSWKYWEEDKDNAQMSQKEKVQAQMFEEKNAQAQQPQENYLTSEIQGQLRRVKHAEQVSKITD